VAVAELSRSTIPGLITIDLCVNRDRRGWFKENYSSDALESHGVRNFHVVQNNVTLSTEVGVLRGIHAEPWEKYVSVAFGRAFAAIVDLRRGRTFGWVQTFDLTPETALYIPRGCGNSYQTVEPNVVYTYLVNDRWSPNASYTSVHPYDPQLSIEWPIARSDTVLSDKDAALPPLARVVPVEHG
jgi:dTDP-4-dehydrorhamnose 3,5-epimerase